MAVAIRPQNVSILWVVRTETRDFKDADCHVALLLAMTSASRAAPHHRKTGDGSLS